MFRQPPPGWPEHLLRLIPRLPEFRPVPLRVLRWQERDKRLVIKDAERVA